MADSDDVQRGPINPEEYRKANPADLAYRLVSADVSVQLMADPRRAEYSYRICIETLGDKPASDWDFEIPSRGGTVTHTRAEDSQGSLQTAVSQGVGLSRLQIRFRQDVQKGEQYKFCYSYESGITSVGIWRLDRNSLLR